MIGNFDNVPPTRIKLKFSDLEVIALSMTSEALSIDSENFLFSKLETEYKIKFPNIISRRQYNDRRKKYFDLQKEIRERITKEIDRDEDIYTIDPKPFQVCKISRMNRCKMGKEDYATAPDFGFCASQDTWYYGYKLHAIASIIGAIHSFDLSKAPVHDIKYLDDIRFELSDCTLIGDKAYLNKAVQLDLFTSVNISLEVPMKKNLRGYRPQFYLFKKVRKRVETVFSQLDDQFMMVRNYAKNITGLFSRILAKVPAMTILQYINKSINNQLIGKIKHTLA